MRSDIFRFNSDKALAVGMKYRSSRETARNLLAWQTNRKMSDKECPVQDLMALVKTGLKDIDTYWMSGISVQHENSLLSQWYGERRN